MSLRLRKNGLNLFDSSVLGSKVRKHSRGTFLDCCARAASGQTTPQPTNAMNSRRFCRFIILPLGPKQLPEPGQARVGQWQPGSRSPRLTSNDPIEAELSQGPSTINDVGSRRCARRRSSTSAVNDRMCPTNVMRSQIFPLAMNPPANTTSTKFLNQGFLWALKGRD